MKAAFEMANLKYFVFVTILTYGDMISQGVTN